MAVTQSFRVNKERKLKMERTKVVVASFVDRKFSARPTIAAGGSVESYSTLAPSLPMLPSSVKGQLGVASGVTAPPVRSDFF
jgi:hypothetical protein